MHNIEFEKSIQKNANSMRELHAHPYYEIYFLAEGERFFLLSNSIYKLRAPALMIIPPHVMHMTQGGPFIRYNVYILGNELCDFEREILDSMALKNIAITEKDKDILIRILDMGVQASKEQYFNYNADRMHMIFAAYLAFFDELKKCIVSSDEQSFGKSEYIPHQYLKIVEYMTENYNQKITLDELAKKFFIAKTTLLGNFKRYFGCSPIDFLLNIRLTKAEKMLFDTKASIEEVSEACGFSSANYFGLIFKKKRGVSPRGYRAKFCNDRLQNE